MIPQNKDTNDFRGSYEKQNNGGYTEIGEKERQEAEIIWELAKKMGVNEEEGNGQMVERLMSMEERDKKEAERVGCINYPS